MLFVAVKSQKVLAGSVAPVIIRKVLDSQLKILD